MDPRLRVRLTFNGIIVFVLGMLIGIPFSMVLAKGTPAQLHLWDAAHLEAFLHGLLLIALPTAGDLVVMKHWVQRIAVFLMISGAYVKVAAVTVSAIWDVHGFRPGGSVANTGAWILNAYSTPSVAIGVVLVTIAIWRGYRTIEDDGSDRRVAIELPQFGSESRHEVLITPSRWENWSGIVEAAPARKVGPTSYDELVTTVREAVDDGYRIKAVGAGYSWSAGAATNGVMIDMSSLDRPIRLTPAEDEELATVKVEAGMTIGELTRHLAAHGLTLATSTVIPWVQVGGAVANGCHGTGRDAATLSDLVVAMDVVGADGETTVYERGDNDTWRSLLVGLGGLGIMYSLTFECIPMHNVRSKDTIVNMPDMVAQLQDLYLHNENLEIFWFPFNRNALVKTWNRTDQQPTEHLPERLWDGLVQQLEAPLARLFRGMMADEPHRTPEFTRTMFSIMGKHDVVCPAPWAMQYQTAFPKVLDMGYAIPIDNDFARIRAAWNAAVEQVDDWASKGRYPQNMVLHARFIGRASSALLSPSEGHENGSCYIEALTFPGTDGYKEYFDELSLKWEALGGRPHWAKLICRPASVGELYGTNLDRFEAVRAELDPKGIFASDYLDEILEL